jgi:hypothetical protein
MVCGSVWHTNRWSDVYKRLAHGGFHPGHTGDAHSFPALPTSVHHRDGRDWLLVEKGENMLAFVNSLNATPHAEF